MTRTALLAAAVLAALLAGCSSHPVAPAVPSSTATDSAVSAAQCREQARAWLDSSGGNGLSAAGTDVGTLGSEMQAFSGDLGSGAPTGADEQGIRSAADAVQVDAQALQADPGPSCIPGMRAGLTAAAVDFSQAASDADTAMDQYDAGNASAAITDIQAISPLSSNGNAELAKATSVIS